MPQIGWFEILIIATIAILVIGPKDFPFMIKKIGSWIGSIKRYVANVQQEISVFDNENIEMESKNKENEPSQEDSDDKRKK
tara:strand:+ start:23 stop:265 length:243 start_codon:yes stop_codon:yes gene_type:complete